MMGIKCIYAFLLLFAPVITTSIEMDGTPSEESSTGDSDSHTSHLRSEKRQLQFEELDRLPDTIAFAPTSPPTPCPLGPHPGFTDPTYSYFSCCEAETEKRLKFSIRYMRAAGASGPFEECVRQAVKTRTTFPYTSNESDYATSAWVGPYVPCSVDPAWIQTGNSQQKAYDVIMNVARFKSQKRRIKIKCNMSAVGSNTAISIQGGEYDNCNGGIAHSYHRRWDFYTESWQSTRFHEMWFHPKISYDYSGHTVGEYINPIFGVPNDGDASPSYPVDELSGIIFHEMLHNYGFSHHGGCAYQLPKCNDSTQTCRFNSLLEIGEQCMSDTVQRSTDNCNPELCVNSSREVPIYYGPNDCRCENFW